MVYEIAPEAKIKHFEETLDVDFGYEVPDVARYRANFFQQKYGISAVFRLIPSKVLTVDDLGLPSVLKKFPLLKKGLILVTGPTGSGKSTTLAAMMDYANLQRHDHIITVEDPIEFVHRSQNYLRQCVCSSTDSSYCSHPAAAKTSTFLRTRAHRTGRDRSQNKRHKQLDRSFAAYCPNCRNKVSKEEATNPPVRYGDRILVLKYLYIP